MTNHLGKTFAAVFALAAAISIVTAPVTASAAVRPATANTVALSDTTSPLTPLVVDLDGSIGVLAASCQVGKAWTNGDNPNSRNYAWASCYDTNPRTRPWNEFRVEWSCTGEGYMRYGAWTDMDGKVQSGTCALGKRVDVNKVGTRYVGI